MKYVFRIAVIAAVLFAGWAILEPEVTNIVFQDELHDLAVQPSWRPGMSAPNSDEELRNFVVRQAETHDIALDPKQVTVRRTETPGESGLHRSRLYGARESVRIFIQPHFSASSTGSRF